MKMKRINSNQRVQKHEMMYTVTDVEIGVQSEAHTKSVSYDPAKQADFVP